MTKKKKTTRATSSKKKATSKKLKVEHSIEEPQSYQYRLAKILNDLNIDFSKTKQKKAIDNASKALMKGKKVDHSILSSTTIKLCHVYSENLIELSDDHIKNLKARLEKAVIHKKKKEEEKTGPTISIQDRIRNNAYEISVIFEDALDNFMIHEEEKALSLSPLTHLNVSECKAPQAKIIKSIYERQHDDILKSKKKGEEYEDYREAYSYLPLKKRNEVIKFYEKIFAACSAIEQKSKVNRKRRVTKKSKTIESMIKNLKYQKEDQGLMAVSIHPEKIIGAKELWVYNTKTRLFGCYRSLDDTGLSVKGTTLQDISLDNSEFKKVRNPKALMTMIRNKKTKRGYSGAYKKLTTKPQDLTARINANMILLAAFK